MSVKEQENWFDRSSEYNAMLHEGLRFTGEDKTYFIEGRIKDLQKNLPAGWQPRTILDFGCGIGDAVPLLAQAFTGAEVVGVDTAYEAVNFANKTHASGKISFSTLDAFTAENRFDLCYINGVFHHILPQDRREVMAAIHRSLKPGGWCAFFENNPWNPGTRFVMSRVPFDKDAMTLTWPEAANLLTAAGFKVCGAVRSLFYFPRFLAFLRFLEPMLAKIPLGAQYYLLAKK